MDGRHGDSAPRPSSWTHRALGAGGRALGQAGQALSSAEQRGASHLGTAHLGTEALVAYVDGELGMRAHQRAAVHLAVCAECVVDVQAQLQARAAVRSAGTPCTPASLLGALRQIPTAQPPVPPTPPAGTTVRGAVVQDADGAWVAVLRPERYGADPGPAAAEPGPRRRGFPLVVLTVSAIAVGVLLAAPSTGEGAATGTGVAPVHTARLPGAGPTPTVTVVGVAGIPQTATSPGAGQAVPAGAPAQV